MTSKIHELTEKIYNEGVEKARKEAEKILSEAEEKAKKIEEDAQLKSAKLIDDAKKESEAIFSGLNAELKTITNEALEVARQKISGCILARYSGQLAGNLLNDSDFISALLLEIIKKWDIKDVDSAGISVMVPEKKLKEFEEIIKTDVAEQLKTSPTLQVDPAIKQGFKITSEAQGFKVSFTDDDLAAFLKSFMKPRVREFLFKQD